MCDNFSVQANHIWSLELVLEIPQVTISDIYCTLHYLLLSGGYDDVGDPVEGTERPFVKVPLDPRLRQLRAPQLERVVRHPQEGHAVREPQGERGHGREGEERVLGAQRSQAAKLPVTDYILLTQPFVSGIWIAEYVTGSKVMRSHKMQECQKNALSFDVFHSLTKEKMNCRNHLAFKGLGLKPIHCAPESFNFN